MIAVGKQGYLPFAPVDLPEATETCKTSPTMSTSASTTIMKNIPV